MSRALLVLRTTVSLILAIGLSQACLAQHSVSEPLLPPASIIVPPTGSYVSDLRPLVRLAPIIGAENYLIEISPEPTFFDRNTISYVSSEMGLDDAPMDGMIQRLRLSGLSHKYHRQRDNPPSSDAWRVPYNLTAMIGRPYGYRVMPCRDWLALLSARIVEDRDDPLQAINEFVSFAIKNEGATSGYYDAFEVLARDMGVCGNTAELVSALAASLGYRSHLLSLKGRDQGHVVATSKRPDGNWVLLDGLYNIMADGDAATLIRRVRREPDFLDLAAFEGVSVPYRYFFDSADAAYQTATTAGEIEFTTLNSARDGIGFSDLMYDCTGEMSAAVADSHRRVSSNVFFMRATYFKNDRWAPWTYSYFIFRPALRDGESIRDNAAAVWRNGLAVPEEFSGHAISPGDGTPFSTPTAAGYSSKFAFANDGLAWLSASADGPYIGMDFGVDGAVAVDSVRIRWVTPGGTPATIAIDYSDDLIRWDTSAEAPIDYPSGTDNFRVAYVNLGKQGTHRAWRIRSLGSESAIAIEYIDFLTHQTRPPR